MVAHAVAAKAAQMQQDTPGLDINTALYRAVEEEGKNITKETVGQSTILGKKVPFTGQEQTAYRGPGATAASPMKMPGSVDLLIPGKWYKDSKGVVKQYDPAVHKVPSEPSGNANMVEDAEDDLPEEGP